MAAPEGELLLSLRSLNYFLLLSSLPAMTGKAVMTSTNRLDSHIFSVDIDGIAHLGARAQTWGAKLLHIHDRCQDAIALETTWFPSAQGPDTGHGWEND